MSTTTTEGPKTYRLARPTFINSAAGMIEWAKNIYDVESNRTTVVDIVHRTWPNIPREAVIALLSETVAATIVGDVVVFTEPDPNARLKEYTVRLAASARVFNEDRIMAYSIEEAIEKVRQLNLEEYRWGYRYEHEDEIDGDQIAYVRLADDRDGDDVEVDLRNEGEPFAWDACEIVKDLAKMNADAEPVVIKDRLQTFIDRASRACTKIIGGMED